MTYFSIVFVGFPVRVLIDTFLSQYSILMGKKSASLKKATDKHAAAKQLVRFAISILGLSFWDFHFGTSIVLLFLSD